MGVVYFMGAITFFIAAIGISFIMWDYLQERNHA